MAFPDVYESIIKEENINDGGYVQMEWNDTDNSPLGVGTACPIDSDYILFSTYYPSQSSAYGYKYSPKFLHRMVQLDYLPFYFKTEAVTGVDDNGDVTYEDVILSTFPFTGSVVTIANALAECLSDHGDLGEWTADTSDLSNNITINFDGATIKSAAQAIADACGVDYYFIWSSHTIVFGSYPASGDGPNYGSNGNSADGITEDTGVLVSATDGGIQYNTFRILGGTKNMSRKTLRGQNMQVTQRLMLDGDSILGGGSPRIMKDLVFDDIYPKMELWIYDVHERRCWLTDENGKKIIDSQNVNDETGETEYVYKQYSKWYFKLAYWNGTELVPYSFNTDLLIANLPLSMTFQPNYADGALPQPLVGREFELVYFDAATPAAEVEPDDIDPNGYQPSHGEFRIIFKVDGAMILPSTSEETIRPYGGNMSLVNNKVTLVNVAMDDVYKQAAKVELLQAATNAIAAYTRDKSSFTYTTYGNAPSLGGEVTSIRTNLITGEVQYTVGNYNSSKGLIGRLSDKIDTINASGGSATTNDDSSNGRGGGVSETSIPLLSRLMGSGSVIKDSLTILRELILGTNGHGVFIDQNGDANMTIGSLTVLGTTHLNEIDVNHIKHTGGIMVVTKANIIVDHVEHLDGGLDKLYFRRQDANGQTIYNQFIVGDLALMMTFNEAMDGSINRYFWREVSAIDDGTGEFGYIILLPSSATHSDPQEGDVVVQLGNTTVPSRQGCTVLGGSGPNGGFFAVYDGFTTWRNAAPSLDDFNSALTYISPKRNKITGDFINVAGDDLQSQLNALRASLLSVTQQSDRQLVIWYGDENVPYPSSGHLNEYNDPAKDWHDADMLADNTDQQELHLEDVYYLRRNNTTRTGGRAWQWIYDSVLGQFLWVEITDVDTLAALEAADDAVMTANEAKAEVLKLADDGIISAGTEKSQLLMQWQDTVAEYVKLIEQAQLYDLDDVPDDPNPLYVGGEGYPVIRTPYNAYGDKYHALAVMLNNGSTNNINTIKNGTAIPSWLTSLNVDTILSECELTANQYRTKWNDYFNARAVLLKAIEEAALAATQHAQADASNALALIGNMGSDLKLDPSEKLTVKREFLAAWKERDDANGGILKRCKDSNNQYINNTIEASFVTPYVNAFIALATYLNGSNGNWYTDPTTQETTNPVYSTTNIIDCIPLWLHTSRMETTENIVGDTWRTKWTDFYAARTALLTELSKDAKDRADNAIARLDTIESDGYISKGSEKTLLLLEWKRVVAEKKKILEQAADYPTVGTTSYVNTFGALATYLNNGVNPTDDILNGVDMPAWLGTNIGDDTAVNASTYRTKWTDYYNAVAALLKAIEAAAKAKTEQAQTDATNALNSISAISNDNKLEKSELPDVRKEFLQALHEMFDDGGIIDQCKDEYDNWIGESSILAQDLEDAIKAIGTFLNGTNGNWSYHKKRIFTTKNNFLPPASYEVGDIWVSAVWNNSGSGWQTGDPTYSSANLVCVQRRDTDASRSIFDWEPVAQGTTLPISNLPIESNKNATFYILDWNREDFGVLVNLPLYISPDYQYTAPIDINGNQFVNLWSEWYTKRTEIMGYLSELAHKAADDAQQAADDAQNTANQKKRVFSTNENELPQPPYDPGDLWINARWNSNGQDWLEGDPTWNGDQLICVTKKTSSQAASIFDWADATTGVRARLQNLGNAIEAEVLNRKNGTSSTLKLDPTSGSISVNVYDAINDTWSTLASITACLEMNNYGGFTGKLKLTADNVVFDATAISLIATNISAKADLLDFSGGTVKIDAENIGLNVGGSMMSMSDGVVKVLINTLAGVGGSTPPANLYNSSWSDSPIATNSTYRYLWMRVQRKVNGVVQSTSYQRLGTDNGGALDVQFTASVSGGSATSTVHTSWQSGDVYMRVKGVGDTIWGDWILVVGETGDTDYSFNISTNATLPTGAGNTQSLQTQLGMVIRQNGNEGEFSFGSYVGSTFEAGLQFLQQNGYTRLILTSDNIHVSANDLLFKATNVDFSGETISLTANTTLTFTGGTIDFTGTTINMNASQINFSSGTYDIGAEHITFAGRTINLTGATLSINADQLTYTGRTIDLTGATISLNASQINFSTGSYSILATDHIDFTGFTFTVKANNIDFESGTLKIAAGNIDFTGTNFTINAERINFKSGSFAISNGSYNTFSVDASGNVTIKGTINAEAGYFKGELQGATGTFSGSLTSNDNKVLLTSTAIQGWSLNYMWRGFAVSNNGYTGGDLATIGARIDINGYDFGRIALVKRPTGTSSTSNQDVNIVLSAEDGSVEANILRGNTISISKMFLRNTAIGHALSKYTCSTANTIFEPISLSTNNIWVINSTVSNSGVALPKITGVRSALGIDANTNFCVRLIINADLGSENFWIVGRNKREDSNGEKPWNDSDYPLMTHWDNDTWDRAEMGAGDTMEFLLIYDSSRTSTISGFDSKYTARIINRQN